MRLGLTIDLEDWESLLWKRITGTTISPRSHIVSSTEQILTTLDKTEASATFFVLADVALKFPALIQSIASCGHEIGCHGWNHDVVSQKNEGTFKREVRANRNLLEDLTGQEVVGYRAPYFSMPADCAWAMAVLAEEGFRYDSSLVPGRSGKTKPHGGPYRMTHGIIEIPPTAVPAYGAHWPFGSAYLPLLPISRIDKTIQNAGIGAGAVILYMHPYNLGRNNFELFPPLTAASAWHIARHKTLHNLLGRKFRNRLTELLSRHQWVSLREMLT